MQKYLYDAFSLAFPYGRAAYYILRISSGVCRTVVKRGKQKELSILMSPQCAAPPLHIANAMSQQGKREGRSSSVEYMLSLSFSLGNDPEYGFGRDTLDCQYRLGSDMLEVPLFASTLRFFSRAERHAEGHGSYLATINSSQSIHVF